jgi:hypothetical protein
MPSLDDVQEIVGGPGYVPVIDVGSGSKSAPAGAPGSQLAPTATTALTPPPPDPTKGVVMGVPTAGVTPPGPPTTGDASSQSLQEKYDIATQSGDQPVDATPDPNFPVKEGQKTGFVANIGAGASKAVAGSLGLPVDAATMLINAGAHAIGVHPIENPVGGAGWFEKLFGVPAAAAKAIGLPEVAKIIDANPEDVAPADGGELLGRLLSEGATSVALPGGIASKAVRAGATAPTLINLAKTAGLGGGVAGAAGGVGGEIAADMVPDRFKPLARMIGGTLAGGGVSALEHPVTATLTGVGRGVAGLVYPSSQIPRIVGKSISENLKGGTPTAAPAPIPSVDLDLAQSTGNPAVASSLDTLNAMDTPAMQQQRSTQNAQMSDVLFGKTAGEPAMIKGTDTTPDRIAAKGSTKAVEGLNKARKIVKDEESRMWTKRSLIDPNVSTETSKGLINGEIARMQRENPGLADAYDKSPLAPIVRDLNAMPEKASARELNSARSNLLKVLRNPNVDGNVKVVATTLADLAAQGLENAPEVAGRAAYSYTPAFPQPGWARAAANGQQVHVPAVTPNPILVRDLAAARAFTKQRAEVLGHASFDAIFKRNSAGNETVVPGTALNRFFDFTTGEDKPGAIRDVSDLLGDIKTEWQRLNAAQRGNLYDPALIDPVKAQLADGTRNFLFGKFLDAITSKEFDMKGNRFINNKNTMEWFDNNKDMLTNSGMVSGDQMSLLERFRATAEMLDRGRNLGRTVNSATFTRAVHPIRFVDAFLGPIVGRLAGAGVGAMLTHWLGEEAIGGMIGAEMGGSQGILQALYSSPREKLMKMLGDAYRNPDIARDLAMKFNANAKASPATVGWFRALLSSQPGIAAGEATGTPAP